MIDRQTGAHSGRQRNLAEILTLSVGRLGPLQVLNQRGQVLQQRLIVEIDLADRGVREARRGSELPRHLPQRRAYDPLRGRVE